MKRTVTFSLDDERDKDMLDWLDSQSNRSAVIRDAVWAVMHGQDQAGPRHDDATLADVYKLVLEIKRDLGSGLFTMGDGKPDQVVEPDEAAAALDSLAAIALE